MISNGESTDKELEEKAVEVYKELEGVFQSANLEVVGVRNRSVDGPLPPEIEQKIADLNNEIISEIDRVVNAEGLKGQIKKLESEIAQGSKDVEKMEAGIKERILAALDVTALNEKIERLREEVKSSSKGVSGNKIGMENGRW